MFWYDNKYKGKSCLYKVNRIKYKISNRIDHPTVYLITLAQNGHGVLEMIPSTLLLQRAYPSEDLRIVGMGGSRRESLELMRQIIEEVYRQQHDFDVAAFMESGNSRMR